MRFISPEAQKAIGVAQMGIGAAVGMADEFGRGLSNLQNLSLESQAQSLSTDPLFLLSMTFFLFGLGNYGMGKMRQPGYFSNTRNSRGPRLLG